MITVIVRMKIRNDCKKSFINLVRDFRKNVLSEPGCLGYDYHKAMKNISFAGKTIGENEIMLIERWATEEDLIAHSKTPHVIRFTKDAAELRESTDQLVIEPIDVST